MKILHWKNTVTNESGHGIPMPDDSTEFRVAEANRRFPHIEHWAEPVPEVDE